MRLARIRATAAVLGRTNRFEQASKLLSAAIATGHIQPWMYESLALALEGAGRPRAEVERALLSAADLASTPIDLLALASYLDRLGSKKQSLRICREVAILEPDCQEAYALGFKLAAELDEPDSLLWTCAGILAHEWPPLQQDIPTRAARLAKSTIGRLKAEGKEEQAKNFQQVIDNALVRDIDLQLTWTGDADIDLVVEEPTWNNLLGCLSSDTLGWHINRRYSVRYAWKKRWSSNGTVCCYDCISWYLYSAYTSSYRRGNRWYYHGTGNGS